MKRRVKRPNYLPLSILVCLIFILLTACRFQVELSKDQTKPTPPVIVIKNEGTWITACDEYRTPILPDRLSRLELLETDMDDSDKVAESLLAFIKADKEIITLRDDIRKKALAEHRATCRKVYVIDKTVP